MKILVIEDEIELLIAISNYLGKENYICELADNASHEMQTPLSVAMLHLDEILQHDLNEAAFEKTVAAIHALKRLSSLNQSLVLLAKIENRQFRADSEILLNDVIKRKLQEFEPLFEAKNLEVEYTEESDLRLVIHEQLSDLLFNNLLSNAVNQNLDGGSIRLVVGQNQIEICNTGKPNTLTGKGSLTGSPRENQNPTEWDWQS